MKFISDRTPKASRTRLHRHKGKSADMDEHWVQQSDEYYRYKKACLNAILTA